MLPAPARFTQITTHIPRVAEMAPPDTSTDEDQVKALKVLAFSSQLYVQGFLKGPLASTFPAANFVEVKTLAWSQLTGSWQAG